MNRCILGVHGGHDATAVLLKDGQIVEAMSEERLTGYKKYTGFPYESIAYIKKKYQISKFDLVVMVGEFLERQEFLLKTKTDNELSRKKGIPKMNAFYRAVAMRWAPLRALVKLRDEMLEKKMRIGVAEKVIQLISTQFPDTKVEYLHHHLAHAWSAVPFMKDVQKRHLILTLDGAGDDASGSINIFDGKTIEMKHKIGIEQSLGLMYSGVTDILGMSRNEHEFKVMGLAPYAKVSSGEKVYDKFKELCKWNEGTLNIDSAFTLNYTPGYLVAHNYYHYRFDSLAYGIQKLTEETIKSMAKSAITRYGIADVAIGGGVFMNVKANQRLLELPEIASLVSTPSCGDESLAIGAAVYGYSLDNDLTSLHPLSAIYLGSEYSDEEIKKAIDEYNFKKEYQGDISVEYIDPTGDTTIEKRVAELLAQNSVVGRFKGRSEWGARALGNRSILANPSSRENVKLINEMIKNRDFWMPFATSMKWERRHDYLVSPKDFFAPYMSITFDTKPLAHKELPAALHPYDLTSRPQMVTKEMNPSYWDLISRFEDITGIGGVLNTSFNLHGEPNVEFPKDAVRTFVQSGLPHLAIGNYLLSKK